MRFQVLACWSAVLVASSAQGQYTTVRVSLSNEQAPGNSGSAGAWVSGDARYVAFGSSATNFSGQPGSYGGVYVRDRVASTLQRVSIGTAGAMPNNGSVARGLSRDGRYVLYDSYATNLVVPDDNGTSTDAYYFDRTLGTTTRVSISSAGVQGNQSIAVSALSGDGRRVAFSSYATNLDPLHPTYGPADVYVRDLDASTTTIVSVGSAGERSNGQSGSAGLALSLDGRFVAFSSQATNLVANDTNARDDVFVRDVLAGTNERVSVANSGAQSAGTASEAAITLDGRFVAFSSDGTDLVAEPMVPLYFRIYVRDRATGSTELASRATDGSACNGTCYAPSFSDDGRYLAFLSSATNLVEGDTNGKTDVFVVDRWTGATRCASVSSSGVQSNWQSVDCGLSGDGRVAVFSTLAWNLVPNDVNGALDVFASLPPAVPVAYCTAKTNSLGCTPAMGSSGSPSASSAAPFLVTASSVLNQRAGLCFYGFGARAAAFQGGTMCVQSPVRRTPVQNSGGNASGDDCSGSYAFDMNARIQLGVDPDLTAGATVYGQYWSRDPASASTTGLTDALAFEIAP